MSAYPVPERVNLFHITHVDNLPSVFASGGLKSYNALRRSSAGYVDVANSNVQSKRARKKVPCGAGGTLHDYVPFYFCYRSPMLYAIHKNNVDGYAGGQASIVHLVTDVSRVRDAGCAFVFTDGHGVKDFTSFYDDVRRLDQVDFPLMKRKYWHDVDSDPDRSRRRQAEFLVRDAVPWAVFRGIGVVDGDVKARVGRALRGLGVDIPVRTLPHLYYGPEH